MGEGLPPLPSRELLALYFFAGALIAVSGVLSSYAFKVIDGSEGGILLMLEIPFAFFLGYFFYDESLRINEVLGGGIIVLSSLCILLNERGEYGCQYE